MFYSPVFGCILKNALKKEKRKKKNHTPTSPELPKNPSPLLELIATHSTNLPWATLHPTSIHRKSNPHRNQPKTHPATHQDPLHKTKNQTPNQPNPINFDPPQHLNPSPASIKSITADLVNLKNKNPDLVLVFLISSRCALLKIRARARGLSAIRGGERLN